ncbi:MAG: BTAD domain-containing putative transcriptional regulator [Pseudonocardia sp.]
MRIRDLGPLVVEIAGTERTCGGAKQAALLSTLAMRANERVPLGDLVVAGWGYDAGVTTASVETHVWRLRRLLEPERPRGGSRLVSAGGGYRLSVEPDELDSHRFARLAGGARGADSPAERLRACDEALALWRGAPYEAVAHATWTAAATARLEELRGQLIEWRLSALIEAGDPARALVDLEPLLAEFPFRERLWALRMTALDRSGRADDALQSYHRVRALLRDELGLEPGTELQQLQRALLTRAEKPAAPARPEQVVRLPGRPTVLIGRDDESREIADLIDAGPLTTITGPGGCGKTSLALQVARGRADRFPDGVWFVDLTEVADARLVVDVAVSRMGLHTGEGADALTVLRSFVRDRRVLLLLDNCEHVLDGVAALVEELLDTGSRSAVLATSREPIDVDGETVRPLAPLSLVPGRCGSSPAAELFRLRAGAAVGAADGQTVERICAAVDGLPLAIELAAARTRSFGLAEILDQVDDDPGALGRVGRGPADHRRTLRSAIEWSHRLLTPAEQLVHRRISVLPGPFTLPVVAALVGSDLDVAEVPTVLARLVHRSLLAVTPSSRPGHPSTFHQLETVRAHARNALRERDELGSTLGRRDGWVRGLLGRRPALGRPEEATWYDALDDSYATVRATLEDALTGTPDPGLAAQCTGLMWFWYYRGRIHEGARWVEAAAARLPGPDGLVARFVCAATTMILGRVDEARSRFAAALAEELPSGDEHLAPLAECLVTAAAACWTTNSWELCATLNDRAAPLVAALGDPDLELVAEAMRCVPGLGSTDPVELADLAERATAIHTQAVATDNICATWMLCAVRNIIALITRDPVAGVLWTERVIASTRRLGAGGTGVYVEALANFLVMRGELIEAVRLYSWAYVQTRRNGMVWPARTLTREFLDRARDGLDADVHREAWESGATLTLDEIVARGSRRARSFRAGAEGVAHPACNG